MKNGNLKKVLSFLEDYTLDEILNRFSFSESLNTNNEHEVIFGAILLDTIGGYYKKITSKKGVSVIRIGDKYTVLSSDMLDSTKMKGWVARDRSVRTPLVSVNVSRSFKHDLKTNCQLWSGNALYGCYDKATVYVLEGSETHKRALEDEYLERGVRSRAYIIAN